MPSTGQQNLSNRCVHIPTQAPVDRGLRALQQMLKQQIGVLGRTIVNEPDRAVVGEPDRH
jgi:hypothetical protein